jgi:hypothetical protein
VTLLGPYLVACGVLVLAGTAKSFRPHRTATVIGQLLPTLPPSAVTGSVRALALAEALLGVSAAAFPRTALASAVAASYAGFAVFVLYLRSRRGTSADCGCLSADSPPTRMHVLLNVGMALSAAFVAAAGSGGSIVSLLARQTLDGVPLIGACTVCAWLVILTLVAVPRLAAARELVAQRSQAV